MTVDCPVSMCFSEVHIYIYMNVSETACKTRAEAVLSGNDLLCCCPGIVKG